MDSAPGSVTSFFQVRLCTLRVLCGYESDCCAVGCLAHLRAMDLTLLLAPVLL
jgi:hypothetical protein